jgi:RNA polymerase sigma-70 factor (ECF subfamily)
VAQDSDEALVARYQRGDVKAFEALLDRHRRGVYRFLVRFLGDRARADDLTQDCWLRFIDAAPRWSERGRFKSWLYAVARNLATDEARRAAHRQAQSLDASGRGRFAGDSAASQGRAPDEALEDALLRSTLEQVIARLPAEQREVFLLREYEGVSFADIAEATGAPIPTVKSRMRYALEALRRGLNGLEGSTGDTPAARSAKP